MIIVTGTRGVLTDSLVFFPDVDECEHLLRSLRYNSILRIVQTPVDLRNLKSLLHCGQVMTTAIDLTQDMESIYQNMNSMTKRYVKKALNIEDQLVLRENDEQTHRDFLTLYNTFTLRHGHTHPLSERRYLEYRDVSDTRVVYYGSRPIVGHTTVVDDAVSRARMALSASVRLQNKEDAQLSGMCNRYLHWKELSIYKDRGIRCYDFGGIGDGMGPIAQFKLSFGGATSQDYDYAFAGRLGLLGYKLYKVILNNKLKIQI